LAADLVSSRRLIGLTKRDLTELLGEPDRVWPSGDTEAGSARGTEVLGWTLGENSGALQVDLETLGVTMGSNSKSIAANILPRGGTP
jgi:hypothetical protein